MISLEFDCGVCTKTEADILAYHKKYTIILEYIFSN
jgi:hypothetical protein